MPLHDLNEFLRLSSTLNYNLSAASQNRYNILTFLLDGRSLHEDDKTDREHKAVAMEALNYLLSAYKEKRRRLGPVAVIHPLRSAALLSAAVGKVSLIDLLTQLFHDILEDIRSTDFNPQEWKDMEHGLYSLMARLPESVENDLARRLFYLTRLKEETYHSYVGRLLDGAEQYPQVVVVKLADRLDNTLDMRLGAYDPLEGVNFFKEIFQLLFVNSFKGYKPERPGQRSIALNAARRLYQLFKNSVLLSLIRQRQFLRGHEGTKILFDAVAQASLLESQRIFLKIAAYNIKDVFRQRALVMDAMEYCYQGRTDLVTNPRGDRVLDGLFTGYFAIPSSQARKQQLDLLYMNKPLMMESAVAFSVIFFSFINNPDFFVQGISPDKIAASEED